MTGFCYLEDLSGGDSHYTSKSVTSKDECFSECMEDTDCYLATVSTPTNYLWCQLYTYEAIVYTNIKGTVSFDKHCKTGGKKHSKTCGFIVRLKVCHLISFCKSVSSYG